MDNASIAALVEEHGKWLMAFLRGLCDTLDDAEDAFQEVWVRMVRGRAGARPSAVSLRSAVRTPRAYLVKTARSVVIDRLRRKKPEVSLDALMVGRDDPIAPIDAAFGGLGQTALPEMVCSASSPAERYESKATATDVRHAIAALPFNWRQVVLMRIEGEMGFKDIAEELNIPLGTALTWMRRATEELKQKLGGEK